VNSGGDPEDPEGTGFLLVFVLLEMEKNDGLPNFRSNSKLSSSGGVFLPGKGAYMSLIVVADPPLTYETVLIMYFSSKHNY